MMFVLVPTMHHWIPKLKHSALVSVLVAAIALPSCGGSNSSPVAVTPEAAPGAIATSDVTQLQADANGTFLLAEPIPATQYAASLRLDVASDDPLPERIEIGTASFVRAPVEMSPGFESYVPTLESFLLPIAETTAIAIPGVSSARIQTAISDVNREAEPTGEQSSPDAVSLLYRSDPDLITINDFTLVYALTFLPEGDRSAQRIADLANTIVDNPSAFAPGDFSPLPDASNTDWASGGRTPAPDITDAAVLASALLLQLAGTYTASDVVSFVNLFLPNADFTESQLRAVPGLDPLPGGSPTSTPSPTTAQLSVPGSISGTLSASDDTIQDSGDTFFIDDYVLNAPGLSSGQTIRLSLNSPDFDTVLRVLDDGTDPPRLIDENDDAPSGGLDSELDLIFSPSITYLVRVSSFSSDTTGAYEVSATVVGGASPTIALNRTVTNQISGDVQVSVQIPTSVVLANSFSLVATELDIDEEPFMRSFRRSSVELFDGFTSYAAEFPISRLADFSSLEIGGVTSADCVVLHFPGTDPTQFANQITVSTACSL